MVMTVLALSGFAQVGADFVGSDPTAGGNYYLYNVKTGLWLGENDCRSLSFGYFDHGNWSTHAELTTRGRLFTVEQKDNGYYRLNGHFGSGCNLNDDNLFLDTGTDCDWQFIPINEEANTYRIKALYGWVLCAEEIDGKPYSFTIMDGAADRGGHQMLDGSDEWKLVTRADRLAWAVENATEATPVDVSFLVVGGPLCNTDDYEDVVWKGDWKIPGWYNIYSHGEHGEWRRGYETWGIDNRDIYQTITDIPAGKYGVNADAVFVSTGGGDMGQARYDEYLADPDGNTKGYVYGSEGETIGTTKMVNGYAISPSGDFRDNGYWGNAIWDGKAKTGDARLIVNGNSLNVGVKVEGAGGTGWIIFDNIGLNYYGLPDVSEFTEALEAVIAEANALAETSISDALKVSLNAEITSAEAKLTSSNKDEIVAATQDLKTVIGAVKVINEATALAENPTTDPLKTALATAITNAETKLAALNKAEISVAIESLNVAMSAVKDADWNYNVLAQTIVICEDLNSVENSAEFAEAINVAKTALKEATNGDELYTPFQKLRMYRRLLTAGHHNITLESAAPADGIDVYFYNVGAGLFLTNANTYGTQSALEYATRAMTLHANSAEEGSFGIQTHILAGGKDCNRGTDDFLGNINAEEGYAYFDCTEYYDGRAGYAWKFEPTSDGCYRIYNVEKGTGKYLGMIEDDRLAVTAYKTDPDDKYNHWKLFTKAQLDEYLKTATPANPVDATYYIKQSRFAYRDFEAEKSTDWDGLKGTAWENNAGGTHGDASDKVVEIWNSGKQTAGPVWVKQTVKGLKPGLYRASVNGFYRDGSFYHAGEVASNPERWAYLTANGEKALLPAITDCANMCPESGDSHLGMKYPNNTSQAAKYFQVGLYRTYVDVLVGADGILELGVSKERTTDVVGDDWVVVDNFRLAYLGSDVATVSEVDYATYVAPFNIAEIPDGVEVYAAKVVDDYVELLRVDAIPEGEAVVLKGAGEWTFTQTAADVELGQENELKAVTAASPVTADGTQYVLAKPENKEVGFYRVISGDAIPAGKGYLVVTGANAKPGYTFFEEGVTDKIDAVDVVLDGTEVIYNLQGQKMTKPVKGVNIINGKKVIIK